MCIRFPLGKKAQPETISLLFVGGSLPPGLIDSEHLKGLLVVVNRGTRAIGNAGKAPDPGTLSHKESPPRKVSSKHIGVGTANLHSGLS